MSSSLVPAPAVISSFSSVIVTGDDTKGVSASALAAPAAPARLKVYPLDAYKDPQAAQKAACDPKQTMDRVLRFCGLTSATALSGRLRVAKRKGGKRENLKHVLRFMCEHIGGFVSMFDTMLDRCLGDFVEYKLDGRAVLGTQLVCQEFKVQFWKALLLKLAFTISRLQRCSVEGMSRAVMERFEGHLLRIMQLVQNQLMLARKTWIRDNIEPPTPKLAPDASGFVPLKDADDTPPPRLSNKHVHKTFLFDETFLLGRSPKEAELKRRVSSVDDGEYGDRALPDEPSGDDEYDSEDEADYDRCHLPSAHNEQEALWRCQMMLVVLTEIDPFVAQVVSTGGQSLFAHLNEVDLFLRPKTAHWESAVTIVPPLSMFAMRRVMSKAYEALEPYCQAKGLFWDPKTSLYLRPNTGLEIFKNAAILSGAVLDAADDDDDDDDDGDLESRSDEQSSGDDMPSPVVPVMHRQPSVHRGSSW